MYFLQKDRIVTESVARFSLRFVQQTVQINFLQHDAHAASAAPRRRFDDERKADFACGASSLLAIANRIVGAGQRRNLQTFGERARRDFIAHQLQQFGARADEGNSRRFTRAGKSRIFRQKPIAGVNRIDVFFFGQRYDAVDVEVSTDRPLAFAD
jgi:hypothetical protein